jgi:hypothetical protein
VVAVAGVVADHRETGWAGPADCVDQFHRLPGGPEAANENAGPVRYSDHRFVRSGSNDGHARDPSDAVTIPHDSESLPDAG